MRTLVLWQKLLDNRHTEELYNVLREFALCDQFDNPPAEVMSVLLGLLDESHDPQVWLLASVLVGKLCNLTSTSTVHLAQRGAVSSLATVLKRCFSSLTFVALSSQKAKLYELLVTTVLSILHHFSSASVCVRRIFPYDILSTVLSAINCNTSPLYVFGSAETKTQLESLIAGHYVVGRRMWTERPSTSIVYSRLLGCDIADILGTDLPAQESFVVDLYDTNSDEDIHIIEQLNLSQSAGYACECEDLDVDGLRDDDDEDDDGEWVDVFVTCVLDGAHFVAVFGAENVQQFHQLRENVEAAVANNSTCITDLPSCGQLVSVSHPDLGGFHAYVVNAESSEKILTFSPEFGYIKEVPLSYLRQVDDSSMASPSSLPRVHVCRLMGQSSS